MVVIIVNIFLISDIHFNHVNRHTGEVQWFLNRPWKDPKTMEEAIIKKWNAVVRPGDLVIVVGDVFFNLTKQQCLDIMSRLNGRKILVRGNHDHPSRQMMSHGFDFACEQMEMMIAGERVTISHYPFKPKWYKILWKKLTRRGSDIRHLDRRPINKGQFLIHGHTHSRRTVNGRMIHVGIDSDLSKYAPIPIGKIENIINQIKAGKYR